MAYHHGDLPAALLTGVESAVAEDGVSAVSLRDVARRAGVSHSAPAYHFGGKAGLLTAFATAGYRLLVRGLSALWISGRLPERIAEHDPQRLAAAVSDLFTEAALAPPDVTSAAGS